MEPPTEATAEPQAPPEPQAQGEPAAPPGRERGHSLYAPGGALRRRATRRWFAGVAGGLADHFATRPLWFRLLFAAGAIISGGALLAAALDPYEPYDLIGNGIGGLLELVAFGAVAAYVLLWWVVPREDLPESAMQRLSRRYPSAKRWPGLALLAVGLVILLDRLGVWRGDVVLAFALIGAGVLLYRRDGAASAASRAVEAHARAFEPRPGNLDVPTGATEVSVVERSLPPRERSALGWITLGVALLVVGGALIWVTTTGVTPRLVSIPALGLVVLAAGLVVGAVYGRARWLILPAIVVVPVLLLASVIDLPLEGHFGGLTLLPSTPGALAPEYRTTVGGIFVDLSRFDGQTGDLFLTATSVLGTVQVVVPYDSHVVAEGRVGYGEVTLVNSVRSGFDVTDQAHAEPRFGDGLTIHLTLESGVGNVQVYREYLSSKERRDLRKENRTP